MADPIALVFATDSNCVIGCAATVRSVLDNARPGASFRVYVVEHGLSGSERDLLARTVTEWDGPAEVRFLAFEPEATGTLLTSRLISGTAYAKLELGRLLPPGLDRCIFLDCDLAFERDVAELWAVELGEATAGAVVNGSKADGESHQRRLGLDEPRYFNSGVLLIDLARWRERDVRGRALAHAREVGDRLILHDQDALNMALQGDWLALPAHWNVWVILPGLEADDDVVFHYMGGPKPWDADYDRPFQDKFFEYLDRTPLGGWRPWNPVGIGAGLARLRRRTPYIPSVLRVLRRRLST